MLTVEGVFYRDFIGPFVPETPLYGPNGVSSCAGAPDWQNAAKLSALWIGLFAGNAGLFLDRSFMPPLK